MTHDTKRRAFELFDRVCDLPPAEQSTYLDEVCGTDPALRDAVERMLRLDAIEEGDLPLGEGAELLASQILMKQGDNKRPTQIGCYTVIREIGSGGMGAVYEAEQENPKRRVALKMVRPGMVRPQLTARLKRESHVLGRLQHPGIAHVYESGTVDVNGRTQPFFAMELIVGERINVHANQRAFRLTQRVELLARACDAVHHAHQKGVIHRDLKPANILVVESETASVSGSQPSLIDDIGQPKVLDFGIARLIENDVTVTTLHTDAGQVFGTLAYMSPEQVTGDVTQLDTRCDIYALGVILWQLLTDRLPFELSGKSMAEAARVICDQPLPRLGLIDARLRGDLETIVNKALEKDAERRYQSAAELAADLRRYIDDQPIMARPPSAMYQLQKFARRNKALVVALAVSVGTLIAGLTATAALLVAVTHERNLKQSALQASESVTTFFTDLLATAKPEALGKDVTVRRVMENARESIAAQFSERPLVEARIRQSLGETYISLAEYDLAEEQVQRALTLWQAAPGDERIRIWNTRLLLAKVRLYQDDYAAAEELTDAILTEAKGVDSPDLHLGETYAVHGLANMRMGKLDTVQADLEVSIKLLEAQFGPDAPDVLDASSLLAELLVKSSPDKAESLYLDLIKRSTATRGAEHPETLLLMGNLSVLYRVDERAEQAVTLLEKVHEAQTRVLGPAHRQTLITVNNLARSMAQTDRTASALALLHESIALSDEVNGRESPTSLFLHYALGRVYLRTDDYAATEQALKESIDLYRAVRGRESVGTWFVELDLLHFYYRRKQFEDAIRVGEELLAQIEAVAENESIRLIEARYFLGRAYVGAGRFEEAENILLAAKAGKPNIKGLRSGIQRQLEALYEAWDGQIGDVADD